MLLFLNNNYIQQHRLLNISISAISSISATFFCKTFLRELFVLGQLWAFHVSLFISNYLKTKSGFVRCFETFSNVQKTLFGNLIMDHIIKYNDITISLKTTLPRFSFICSQFFKNQNFNLKRKSKFHYLIGSNVLRDKSKILKSGSELDFTKIQIRIQINYYLKNLLEYLIFIRISKFKSLQFAHDRLQRKKIAASLNS